MALTQSKQGLLSDSSQRLQGISVFGAQPLSAADTGGVSDARASLISAKGGVDHTGGDHREELAALCIEDLPTRRSV